MMMQQQAVQSMGAPAIKAMSDQALAQQQQPSEEVE